MIRFILLALLLAIPANAGTFIRNGEIKTLFMGPEGASSWNALNGGAGLTITYDVDQCLGIAFGERPETAGLFTCTGGTSNARDALRFPRDVYIIEAVWSMQLATTGLDDCVFQFAIVDGLTMVGDEFFIQNRATGSITNQPIGISLAAGDPLFLNVREEVRDAGCGASLGKQHMFIRYIE